MNEINKNNYKKSILLFLLLIILTFYILLKDQDFNNIYKIIKTVNIKYLLIGIVCMCLYSLGEALNIKRALKILNKNVSIFKSIKYALVGFFFSSVTPSASGGQPMQVYYMYKDKINISTSTLSLLIEFSSFQFITIVYSIIGFIYNYNYIKTSNLFILFLIGILINLIILLLILIAIFSKRLSKKIINICIKLINKFKKTNKEKIIKNLEEGLNNYQQSAILIKNNKQEILKIILTAFIRITIFYTIPYWIYKSIGLNEYNSLNIIFMQAVLYTSVSSLPLPGAVGVSEGSFQILFKKFIPIYLMSSVIILNRAISFYSFVLISGIIISIVSLKAKKK